MHRSTIYFLLLLLPAAQFKMHGQQARYTSPLPGQQVSIVGRIGNSFHTLSTTIKKGVSYNRTIITIAVFSTNLDRVNQKDFLLDDTLIKNISFQVSDSFYYANIVYSTEFNKTLLLKVDAAGNITNVTNTPGLWKQDTRPPDLRPVNYFSNNSSSKFSIKNGISIAAGVADTTNTRFFAGESFQPDNNLQRITIQKINKETGRTILQRSYATANVQFFRPLITASDTSIFACAFAQQIDKIKDSRYKGAYLFLCQMDTNLADYNKSPAMISVAGGRRNETYHPSGIYPLAETLLIVSAGMYYQPFYRNSKNTDMTDAAIKNGYYFTQSLRISQTTKSNTLLLDTILDSDLGKDQLLWDNRFITTTENGMDLFCLHQYPRSKTGITQLSVNVRGEIAVKEMLVDLDCIYSLTGAKKIGPGLLLIPCLRKGQWGIMRLAFKPAG